MSWSIAPASSSEAPIAETSEALWDETIAVNLTAAWMLSRALLPGLRRRRGVIVNVASDAGLLGYAGCAAYCASKGALIGLTRALAVELAPDVRAVAVCPGPVETDMMREAVAAAPDPEAARRTWATCTMLRRVATPAEIAEAIAFAASPRAAYMTGDRHHGRWRRDGGTPRRRLAACAGPPSITMRCAELFQPTRISLADERHAAPPPHRGRRRRLAARQDEHIFHVAPRKTTSSTAPVISISASSPAQRAGGPLPAAPSERRPVRPRRGTGDSGAACQHVLAPLALQQVGLADEARDEVLAGAK